MSNKPVTGSFCGLGTVSFFPSGTGLGGTGEVMGGFVGDCGRLNKVLSSLMRIEASPAFSFTSFSSTFIPF